MNAIALFFVSTVCMCAMHTISTLIGASFPLFLSPNITVIVTVVLFFLFGIQMIYSAITADDDDEEEKEVQQVIEERETA